MRFLSLDLDEPGGQMMSDETDDQVQSGLVGLKHQVVEAFRMVVNMV